MDAYLYLVLFAEFLEENTTPILIVLAEFIMFVGFLFGWLVGHLRNNNYTQALMNKREAHKAEIEKLKTELKDSGEFFNHEMAVLTKEVDRRQCIINAYRIGQDQDNAQHNRLFVDTAAIRLARAKLEAQTGMRNVCSLSDITPQEIKNMIEEVEEVPDELLQSPLL